MSRISSSSVFHFTSTANAIIGILRNCFYPHYSLESLSVGIKTIEYAYPMVCFCDIPLSQIESHINKYGEYGIGMSREWAVQQGLNPVLYCEASSVITKEVFSLLKENRSLPKDIAPKYNTSLINILRYLKPHKGKLYKQGSDLNDIIFYDEREWRFMPNIDSNLPILLKKEEFSNQITLAEANTKCEACPLDFQPEDIKYIIVKHDSEILSMINALNTIKGRRYDADTVKRLTSRIITSKQILEDF
jgi:hypothetical protein